MEKLNKSMEYLWLMLGIVLTIYTLVDIYNGTFEEQGQLLLLPMMCFVLYYFRRTLRKKREANNSTEQ